MVRITAGNLKNRQLKVPSQARPLTDQMRLSVFDTISDFVDGADVLDLFAGSGICGIEAISRGANRAEFVENSYEAIEAIKRNLTLLQIPASDGRVVKMDVYKYLKNETDEKKFDIIFYDPPFDDIREINFDLIGKKLKPDGIVVVKLPLRFTESGEGKVINSSLEEVRTKKYGSNQIVFYRPKL